MRGVFVLISIFLFLGLLAQDTTRGISIPQSQKQSVGVTRALIVGISTYQNLPSLHYADKDAEEFSSFLQSNRVWQVSPSNIKLLTNEKAKAGDIISWLNWLLEKSEKGDNIVFYFSGHGDVETNKDVNKGYLMAHDAPKNNYIAGGAIAIDVLREIYTEMIDRGIRLYMVTDACRAGHLAGGSAGSKITAESFSKQWRNEIKILSAQPDELSYEGMQWGGGRGVFSFFLTKGLSGYADINKDSSITLAEIEQYVGLQVSQETGFKQQPVFEGASKYSNKIAGIDQDAMARYSQYKSGSIAVAVIAEKGEANIDAGKCGEIFESFKRSIDNVTDSTSLANALNAYTRLSDCNDPALQSNGRFQVTAMLMNYVQQIVNQTLIGQKLMGPDKLEEALTVIDKIYQLNDGKRLVNKNHLDNVRRYLTIQKTIFWDEKIITPEAHQQMVAMLDSALIAEPGAAYLELTRGMLFMEEEKYDSAFFYYRKAIEHSPTWLMAYYFGAQALGIGNKKQEAVKYMEDALALDSAYQKFECAKCFYDYLGDLYADLNLFDKAEENYLKAAAGEEYSPSMASLALVYHAQKKIKERDKIIQILRQNAVTVADKLLMLELDMQVGAIKKLAAANLLDSLEENINSADEPFLYYLRGSWAETFGEDAVEHYRFAYESVPENYEYADAFIWALISEGQYEEAEDIITSVKASFRKNQQVILESYLATIYTYDHREAEALTIFKTLISQGYMSCRELKQYKPLRKLGEYKEFMKICK